MICKIYLRRSRPPQNQNQKEKFESELKSQIKKLQRYRDDIKARRASCPAWAPP